MAKHWCSLTQVVGPQQVCGNGIVEGLEQCDDGDTKGGNGCSPTCQVTGPLPPSHPTTPPQSLPTLTPAAIHTEGMAQTQCPVLRAYVAAEKGATFLYCCIIG